MSEIEPQDETFEDFATFISFDKIKKHTIDYDPKGIVRRFQRRDRKDVPHLLVKEDGAERWLPISSTRLQSKLKAQKAGRLTIEQIGSGFDTDYNVETIRAK